MSTLLRRQFTAFFLIVMLCMTMIGVADAATPPSIVSYQGRVLNANGVPVSDTSLSIKFKLYDASSGGTCLWSNSSSSCATSTARTVTLSSGLFSENLGDTSASYAAIEDTVFANNATVYLGITIGADSEMSPRKRITAAPYALNASMLDGIDSRDFVHQNEAVTYDISSAIFLTSSPLQFEGSTLDSFQTAFAFTDPTADRTITFQNSSGTVAFLSDIGSVSADSLDFTDFADSMTLDASTTISGNILSLNANSNFAVNINTGTSSGALSLGGGSGTVAINSSDWDIDATGAMTGIGAITSDGTIAASDFSCTDCLDFAELADALTLDAATTISGNTLSLNANSNFAVNINTGTSSGALSLGGGSGTVAINSSDWDIDATGAMTGIGAITSDGTIAASDFSCTDCLDFAELADALTLDAATTISGNILSLNANSNFAVNINTGTSSGALSLGGGSGTVAINSSDWDIDATGAMTGIGAITSDGTIAASDFSCTDCLDFAELADALTLDAATTISGNTLSLNANSDFAVNINTGTSSGALSLGGGSGTVAINSTKWDVSSSGDMTTAFTLLDGSSTASGIGTNSTSLTLADATNFDIGNYVYVNSTYAKITNKVAMLLTITPALTWGAADPVTEYHIPEVGGTNLTSTLANRYGMGYFIGGIVAGNGSTYYSDKEIAVAASSTFNFANDATTLNVGSTAVARTINIGTGTSTDYINIGTDNTSQSQIQIGNSELTSYVNLDSGSTSGGIFMNERGAITKTYIGSNSTDGASTVQIATNSTTADTITIGNNNVSTVTSLGGGSLYLNNLTGTNETDIGGNGAYSATDTINIATNGTLADTISIGNSNTSTLIGITGGDDWNISTAGLITTASNIALNGGDLTSTAAIFNFLDQATTKTIDIGGVTANGADTINIGTNSSSGDSISVGNNATTTSVSLTAGSIGGVYINGSAGTNKTYIGGNGGFDGTDTVQIATDGTSTDTVTIGSNSTLSSLSLRAGSGSGVFINAELGGTTKTYFGGSGADTIEMAANDVTADTISIGNGNVSTTVALTGGNDWSIAATGISSFTPSAAPASDIVSISSAAGVSTTSGVDGLSVTFGSSNASGDGIRVTPSFAGGATDFLTYNAIEVAGFSPTNGAGNDFVNGLSIEAITDPGSTVFSSAITVGSGWDFGLASTSGASPVELKIKGGNAFTGSTTGAAISITAGTGGPDGGNGGGVTINTGLAQGAGTDGAFYVQSGDATVILSGDKSTFQVNLSNTTTYTERVCHSGADAATGVVYIGDCQASGQADYAEMYPVNTGITYGDIVVPGAKEVITSNGDHIVQLVKSSQAYQGPVSGIVSNNYGDPTSTGYNVPAEENPMPIGLVGRVPVNVTNENGPIHVGDFVTTSSTPGKGMKATLAGRVVGMALSDFDGVDGQVVVQIANTWYMGNLLSNDGTSNLLTDNVIVAPVGTASSSSQTFDSYGLALRGSAWDGNQAQAVSMMFKNKVTDGSNYRLSVRNTTDSEVAYITNTGTMQVAGDMVVGGKIYPSNLGGIQTDKYIYYDGSVGPGGDFMRTNASGWSTGSYDFAEMFPSSETLVPGDVVVFSDENIHVKRSTQKNEKSIAGIVSTRPGFLAGENTPGSYPIALAGRVPTNVNNENGAIAVGDPLTTSSVSGAAMKATEAGPIVGYALEPFDGTEGSITVFVSAGYWGGDATSSTPGTDNRASLFGASGNSSMSTLSMGGNINMNGNEISNIGRMAGLTNSWSIEMDGTIKTEALLKTVITGQNNQKVETIATTSPEAVITLSGSSTLKEGMAEVRFFDINKDFGNVISAIAPIRVVATPNGPVSLYVSEKDQNHFVVKSFGGNASDVEFDWVVTGYRKGFEPVVEETPSVTAEVSIPTEPTTTEVAPVATSSESNAPASAPESSTNTQTQPEASPSDVPASSPSASTTIVDPSVTDADASASTSSP